MKKIIIPETIAEWGKKEPSEFVETKISFSIRIRPSTIKKLKEKSLEYGHSQQEIVDKAIVAFLK